MSETGHDWHFLFPTMGLMDPKEKNVKLTRLKETGPYPSLRELYNVHGKLQREDYLCALEEQIAELRRDKRLLDTNINCYRVEARCVQYRQGGRFQRVTGVEFKFDASKYQEVEWDEEKRLMRNNIVLLTQNGLDDFLVGRIEESGEKLLRKGEIVVAMIEKFADNGYPTLLDQEQFVGHTFHMVESDPFHFPYLQVSLRLTKDEQSIVFGEELFRLYDVNFGVHLPPSETSFQFEKEIVDSVMPSRPPPYMQQYEGVDVVMKRLRRSIRTSLNSSQALALKKILQYRVALVQGPPGTGKTYLGSKAAQMFVEAKRQLPTVFPGPVLVFSASNHAVQEFLLRCREFSDQVIHCCSNKHERDPVDFGPLQKEHDLARHNEKPAVLQRAEIIGMTTTRAACLRNSLDSMKIKVVIVEEAAEVLEAHVLACIPYRAEHLVQIGDHRQLRPGYGHRQLAEDYNLCQSLFERMVNNRADCPMLNEQRRMRPTISRLVRSVYPNLVDHPSTFNRPRVSGVDLDEPVWFIDHGNEEQEEGKSYKNPEEAAIAVELANYLLLQNNDVRKITILTTYRRQLRLLKQLLQEHANDELKNLRISTVDGFQGEENDVIILSLVRCNPSGKAGFLKMANRACVALSRARNGFFMLGNLFCLTSSREPVWLHVQKILTQERRVGPVLPLLCQHGQRVGVRSAADIRAACQRCALCRSKLALASVCKALEGASLRDD
ncbi:NFX1-type zinc finger-containing protein 1-like isoform X2 [Thrips palmi]|uniref:NFX1-type zinc finger-containing protein 1-like isoform X2 n=1 Tax=Thrips palmi TaxID=161013 RepID=A0A6P8ZS84_THRPL|nr:NFX1-type zinc finger-containing protein 1-like isoform X2 [Thrips palmi]